MASSFVPAQYSCLGCALEDLRRVDTLLTLAVDFWSNMELLIDHLLRRMESTETMLVGSMGLAGSSGSGSGSGSSSSGAGGGGGGAGSPPTVSAVLSPELSSLTEYASFWRVLAYLCEKYVQTSKADMGELFGWLSEPSLLP